MKDSVRLNYKGAPFQTLCEMQLQPTVSFVNCKSCCAIQQPHSQPMHILSRFMHHPSRNAFALLQDVSFKITLHFFVKYRC